MMSKLWTRNGMAIVVAMAMFVGLAALVLFGVTSSEPVSNAMLGPDWQCSRLAFVLTSCSRIGATETPPVVRARSQPDCP
ncbi:hypothetical protein [Bradyrhizobium lablabi]|uniref:hypothetical protein n=1 Tax=Bradyrhizobium lablabi TaxID=722472 RepID=UPI001BA5D52E|nr:hypothetical protein [Bradyrhizobium lablabi]MBR0693102.1 hypothetical protein [Bradyrhizobium lablabi]